MYHIITLFAVNHASDTPILSVADVRDDTIADELTGTYRYFFPYLAVFIYFARYAGKF